MIEITKTPIFTQEIYTFNLPDFKIYEEQIKQIILVESNKAIHGIDTSPDLECNVKAKRTAWNSHKKYNILNQLSSDIAKYVGQIIESENYDVPEIETKNCWINWYGKGQNALPHNHRSTISAVLFVDVEDTDAVLMFHSDQNLVLHKKTDTHTNFSDIKTLKAHNGLVVCFDGSIFHSVTPNLSDHNRVTFAVNYTVHYPEPERNEY
tara:strand:- start:235 stop:858 length:624 start_codon:yes stop_codon:yes gene_type:complete